LSGQGVSRLREFPKDSCLPLSELITDANTKELITCGRQNALGTAQLL
jgi:hypothetical protein